MTTQKPAPKVHITVTEETYEFLEKLAGTGFFGGKKVTTVASFLLQQKLNELVSKQFLTKFKEEKK